MLDVFYFAVSTADEGLRDDDVVGGGVATESGTVLADDVDVVEQLALYSFENEYIGIFYLIDRILI